ncbi:hypothetical protein Droror1_Dr00018136 [Drosera rotundifolia]
MENEIEENYQGDAYSQGSKRRASETGVNDDSKAYAKKKREKTSPVWAQFEELPIDESTGNRSAKCKICRIVISQGDSSSTTALIQHLKSQHSLQSENSCTLCWKDAKF